MATAGPPHGALERRQLLHVSTTQTRYRRMADPGEKSATARLYERQWHALLRRRLMRLRIMPRLRLSRCRAAAANPCRAHASKS
eukprot:946419-Pyramimonas_sp.AAC.1